MMRYIGNAPKIKKYVILFLALVLEQSNKEVKMRCTKLSCSGLIEQFNNLELGQHWKFFHLYEMGNILSEGGEESRQAEAFFRDLLDSDNPDEVLVALRHLAALEYMDVETHEKLERFKKKPSSREILKQVKELAI